MTFTPTTNDPLIGKILAERYRITELVGAGRFSIVYKGQHLFMDRAVAMKTLQTNLVEDPTIIKRFEKEAVALSKLRHPNIVSVYDCFVHTNGQPFLVMDFLDGHTLEELLNERGAIPPKLMRAIIFQASAGLAHAHQSGVLHRDIKPDNIILLPREKTDERVRLLDFGFALLQGDLERLTLSGTLCGSPAYISPERWKGKELDARSDIYSLAVVMFQGLTGQLPFKASSLEELRNMHVSQEPPKIGDIVPSLKDDLVAHQVLEKALAKDPEQRYQTMKEFHNAIKQWSPNSDDAEIAQWAKNVAPKPAPKQGQPVAGQPTNGQPAAALPTTAQPISLQPMPSQTVQPQAPAGSPQSNQQASFSPPPGNSQAAASSPATSPPPASPGAKPFDEAATLPNNQTKPGVDDSATLPKSDSAAQAPIPMGADQQPPAKGYVAVDINSHPLSPEALAKIPKPNPRASLTKMDVAYIQAIAKTLGDSLGDEAKSIEITPALEEELAKAPREETTKLDFNSMPPPVVKSTIPEPGPKVTPAVDRRQNRQGEMSQEDIDTLPASTWPAPDMSQSLMPAAKPFGMNRPGGQPNAPAQPPKPVPAPGQAPQATPATPPTPAAPAAKAPEQPVASEWSAKQAVPEKPEQPVPSDWTVKQEVAPWVQNPDDFKPKSGDFSTPQSSRETDTGSASFGAPGSPPPFPMGASQNAAGPAPGFPTGPAEQSPAAASFGASSWAPQTGPVFGQAPPGITP
ncbi:MAG TPA: protein kinase, partial [Candidatus Melainabacteria bacterium]|nr:protein kinase [Candidatus Melainabacteria bacterium]